MKLASLKPDAAPAKPSLGRDAPLLQELWAVKASLNAGAGFDLAKLRAQAEAFDPEATLARLRREAGH